MKKLNIIIILLFMVSFISLKVYGATETVNYPLVFTEDKRWDIATGLYINDTNYRSTTKHIIRESEITLNNLNFNHMLFWNSSGTYLGYYNTTRGGYENSKYLGDTGLSVTLPLNAHSFAITGYELSPNDTPIPQLNNHTLREVFEGDNRVKSVGKNLFDKGLPNYRSGGYYSITTGAWTNDSNYDALTAIQVKPSTVYIWSVSSNRNKIYFDENENFISGTASASFTTPSNAKYVVISRNIASDSLNTLQLEQGTVATTYAPYISSENDDLPPFVYWYGLDYFGLDLTVSQMDYWYSVYQTTLNEDWDDGISALLFYSVEATYDREEIVTDDRTFIEKIDDWMDDFGLGTFMKILISFVIMGVFGVILAIAKANGIIIFATELIFYILFSVFGWFPMWLVVIIALLIIFAIYINIKGGSSE